MLTNTRVTAVLGPTNTGKTHYAIDRMLGHRTGVIGLPLRLLAREVYDRIVAARGPSVAALVTGEERIVGDRAQYWICTVEAMPLEIGADFVAVDEIQLCADPERGHVFTDRLLRARGLVETMFLGSEAMRGAIAALVPKVTFLKRERFSTLTYTGSKKISRMPARSAIVGFSVDNVYAIAELIRRQKGGCAVVMGALSPRTRNAQVAMYQNGEVDYLVATDAIGMGLNLDIRHVAFSATAKFDGRRMRHLFPHEMGQIAGRAGRHLTPGTFGVTGEAAPLDDDLVEALENHRFAPVRRLSWRNDALDFGSVARLVDSLEAPTTNEWLDRAREADDLVALKTLSEMPEVATRLSGPQAVRLLWDVCRVPDFRGVSEAEHASLLARIFGFLVEGQIPSDWMARAVARIDRTEGDIDTLSKRLAFIRTYTYVAQRKGWLAEESHWRGETRAVEDRLSDALHAALTKAFVDRRTSVLMRRLKQRESLVAEVNDKGEVTVEGEFVGRLEGFRFRQDAAGSPDEARTLRQAAVLALRPEFHLRADRFYNAPDTEVDFTAQGGLMWGTNAVGKLVKGADILHPVVEPFVDEDAGPEVAEKVRRRLQHFIDRKVAALFEPLTAMQKDEGLQGLARGFAFRLVEGLGILPREAVADEAKALDQEARAGLRKHGVRFGQFTIFQPLLLKPKPTALRLVLWSLANGVEDMPESPPPGLVTIPNLPAVPRGHYTLAGYHPAGARAIRIDMLERLADLLRAKDSRAGFEATPDMLSITGMTLEQFAGLMEGLGYRGVRAERAKVKAEAAVPAAVEGDPAAATGEPAAEGVVEAVAEPEPEPAAVAEAGASEDAAPVADSPAADAAPPEMEVFYTFTWAPRARAHAERNANRAPRPAGGEGQADRPRNPRPPRHGQRPQAERRETPAADPASPVPEGEARADARPDTPRGDRPRHKHGGKPQGERTEGKHGDRQGGKPPREGQGDRGDRKGGPKPAHLRDDRPKTYEARPPRAEKPIDPDNPFAVLAALKGRV
jgi:ATP-dependent RNA helicase SUPV3L1/SUV3